MSGINLAQIHSLSRGSAFVKGHQRIILSDNLSMHQQASLRAAILASIALDDSLAFYKTIQV